MVKKMLQKKREKKGLSISKLARISGINRNLISQLERGENKYRPSSSTIIALSKALGCKPVELFRDAL